MAGASETASVVICLVGGVGVLRMDSGTPGAQHSPLPTERPLCNLVEACVEAAASEGAGKPSLREHAPNAIVHRDKRR